MVKCYICGEELKDGDKSRKGYNCHEKCLRIRSESYRKRKRVKGDDGLSRFEKEEIRATHNWAYEEYMYC